MEIFGKLFIFDFKMGGILKLCFFIIWWFISVFIVKEYKW